MNNNYYVVFSSVTYATRIKRKLLSMGREAAMMHTPGSIPVNGCSYSIRVRREMLPAVLAAADEMGIRYKGIYAERGGSFEEVVL